MPYYIMCHWTDATFNLREREREDGDGAYINRNFIFFNQILFLKIY